MNDDNKLLPGANEAQRSALAGLFRSWFELTANEQKIIVIILALFLLGLAVRYWHLSAVGNSTGKPASEQTSGRNIPKSTTYRR